MTFLTNKPIAGFKDITCKITGYNFSDVTTVDIPKQVVVDCSVDAPLDALNKIIDMFKCQYIEAPIEFVSGNTVFIIQEAQQNLIKLDII